MAKYLITGGAGFIGSHIADKLVELGHEVVIFDDFSAGKMENLKAIENKIKVIKGDVRDLQQVRTATENIDFIAHHAAQISVPKSMTNPQETLDINTLGTLNVLIAAQENGVKKITFASSSAVYGDTKNIPTDEEESLSPLSPYAVSKALSEYYCETFASLYKMDIVIFRYFNVFGPRQAPSSPYSGVISKFISRVRTGEPLEIYGDGEQTRDFVPVEKVVEANITALGSDLKGSNIFNIGSGKTISIKRLAETISQSKSGIRFLEARQGDIMHSCANANKVQKRFGLDLSYDLAEKLAKI